MSITQKPNFLYDLSNPHFEQTEILTTEDKVLKGQFVEFKVVKGEFENLYPAEKYCFLPAEQQKRYWKEYAKNKGEFAEFPAYVIQISMFHIRQISIAPALVPGVL